MSDLREPTSVEEAIKRRAEILSEKISIEAKLADRNLLHNGRRLTDREYHTWRASVIKRIASMNGELSFLKNWIATHNIRESKEANLWCVVDDGPSRLSAWKEAFGSIVEYIQFLERETTALRDENNRLKNEMNAGQVIDF